MLRICVLFCATAGASSRLASGGEAALQGIFPVARRAPPSGDMRMKASLPGDSNHSAPH